jgi:hypothetical protein
MLFIEGRREGYAPDQCRETMTVQELIDYLAEFDPDEKVYLNNDNGYTYGSITESSFERAEGGEDE